MILPVVLLIIFLSMYFAFHQCKSIPEFDFHTICFNWWRSNDLFLGCEFIGGSSRWFHCLVWIGQVETGIVMVIYLNDAMQQLVDKKVIQRYHYKGDLREYVIAGAAKRLQPKLMTVSVSLFALIPILWSHGVGSDVMKPIVLPMVGCINICNTYFIDPIDILNGKRI